MIPIEDYKKRMEKGILDKAQISYKTEDFVKEYGEVYVHGGGLFDGGRVQNPPHFIVIPNNSPSYKVIIPTKTENELSADDIELLDKMEINKKDIERIINWLKLKSISAKEYCRWNMSNLRFIASQWNTLNGSDDDMTLINISIYE